jgi:protein TIF31
MYIQLTTNEGEQFQITSHVSGFFVNRSSNSKFDPSPRPPPKDAAAHSLLSLISRLSPSFDSAFRARQEHNGRKDPLASFQITNAIPSSPWMVSASESALSAHEADLARTQEIYLLSGTEGIENLRDWNEEFQATRELPKETIQDRVFRERITSKLYADYNDAAARGAVAVARGEVQPLNPTERPDAQIFVHNNIFFSFGADGVGTFSSEGGDEAARVAVGKDVTGVRLVNQLDIDGLFLPGTVVVDYLGKRIVGQSIVPGIFKPREPGENQIDYGGVEGRDVIADNEAFVPSFSKLSKALRVKRHDVWDREGKKFTLEASVETKGLIGTDGRKYVLDLYRLTPLDIAWLEEYWSESVGDCVRPGERDYPHRMTVFRSELVEAYWRFKMTEYVRSEVQRRREALRAASSPTGPNDKRDEVASGRPDAQGDGVDRAAEEKNTTNADDKADDAERVDISDFSLAFNPDVFCGQTPTSDEEKQALAKDEMDVREMGKYLREVAIPDLIQDLDEGDVGFPMDGQSLTRLMHKRGINIRYLGELARLASGKSPRLEALGGLAIQEMIARAFTRVAGRHLKNLPAVSATSCLSHLLNCLLGTGLNDSPKAPPREEEQSLYPDADWSYRSVGPDSLRKSIQDQVHLRYRHELDDGWFSKIKHLQLLREISLKLGLQLTAKNYLFEQRSDHLSNGCSAQANGTHHAANGASSKKKKKTAENELSSSSSDSLPLPSPTTFEPDDIVNIVPIVKDTCPRSTLADEALEAGRISMAQNQKDLGQELLLESLSLHEQIYGILHPEVARVYHQLSMLYYQLDEKSAAVELARKAVVVSERTIGLDSSETVLSYLNLALFEHANGNTRAALAFVKHALELWKIVYGLNHPDSITTINNAAVMLQALKHYHESRLWFEKSLEICEEVSGKNSINCATLNFQLAQALALDQDAKGAVNRMRSAYSIFLAKLGPEDRNTKESESWLEQLTQNAVSIAKHAKDVQARRLRRIQLTPRVTLGTRPQPQVGQSPADVGVVRDAQPVGAIDPRSVDELIRFIEGGGDTAKRTSAKKRPTRSNPKSRAARTAASPL